MKKLYICSLVALGCGIGAQQASAASLGLTTETPTIASSTAIIDYFEFAPDGDLSAFGAAVDFADGISLIDPAFIDFGVGFSLADPTDTPSGGFSVFDDFGINQVLSGDVIDIGFTTDTIEMLFGTLSGSQAGSFGNQALMTIAFDDPLGANPFTAFQDFENYGASISISRVAQTHVIPLPAGLPLLLTAFAGLALIRQQRARKM